MYTAAPVQAMMAYRGRRVTVPLIRKLDTRRRWVHQLQNLIVKPMDFTSVSRIKITRHAMYVQRNDEIRSGDYRCNGKATSITHSKKVFVVLGIQ
jgi:hypothetical protein